MPAEKNEGGNVPAHDKDANGNSHDGGSKSIYISQVFRPQEKRFGAKAFHEATTYYRKKEDPEYQQHLVFSEMQEKELNG